MTPQAKRKEVNRTKFASASSSSVVSKMVNYPSAAELESLCKNLPRASQTAISSLIPEYCNSYIPLRLQGVLPKPLTELFQKEYMSLLYHMLLEKVWWSSQNVQNYIRVSTKILRRRQGNKRNASFGFSNSKSCMEGWQHQDLGQSFVPMLHSLPRLWWSQSVIPRTRFKLIHLAAVSIYKDKTCTVHEQLACKKHVDFSLSICGL